MVGETWRDDMPGQPLCTITRIVASTNFHALIHYTQRDKSIVQIRDAFLTSHTFVEPEPKTIWERLVED